MSECNLDQASHEIEFLVRGSFLHYITNDSHRLSERDLEWDGLLTIFQDLWAGSHKHL